MSFDIGRFPITKGEVINSLQTASFSQNVDSLSNTCTLVNEFANYAFPDRTQQSVTLKMFEEFGELIGSPSDPSEYADVFILLFDLAACNGVDIGQAIRDKIGVLIERSWSKTEMGTYQHTATANGAAVEFDNGVAKPKVKPHTNVVPLVDHRQLQLELS